MSALCFDTIGVIRSPFTDTVGMPDARHLCDALAQTPERYRPLAGSPDRRRRARASD